MKYPLILLLFPCVCWGQPITDTTGKIKLGGDLLIATTIMTPKQDTIPVRILYSYIDSVKAPGLKYLMYENDTLVLKETDEGYIFDNRVYWQYGYEVSGYEEGILPNGAAIITWPDKKYLDQNKDPLSKNIVVWLTKEIKQ